MKTLSFLKQALAVALLISASQATAMDPATGPAQTTATGPAQTTATAAATATGGTAAGSVSLMTKAWNGFKATPGKGRNFVQWPARFTAGQFAKLSVPYYGTKKAAAGAAPAVKGKVWTRTVGDVTNSAIAYIPGKKFFLNGDQYNNFGGFASNAGWFVAGAAIYTGAAYGLYKLYKKFAQPEQVTAEENKEDAEPTTEEVVVVEETTAQPAPVKKSAQSRVYNPAA